MPPSPALGGLGHHDGAHRPMGALLALGASVRAADLAYLDDLEPYRRPRPMQVRQIPSGLGIRKVPYDPEDEEVAAVAASTP